MAQTLAHARSPADAWDAILMKNRWIKTSMGSYKSGPQIKEIQVFRLYVRKTALGVSQEFHGLLYSFICDIL